MKNAFNTDRTILDQAKLHLRKLSAIALAFTLGAALTGCEPDTDQDQYEHQDIANLGQYKNAKLVTRNDCINELKAAGSTPEQATKSCDDALADAIVHAPAQYAHNDNNGSSNDALWWYVMMNNRPVVYYGNPSSGLTYYGGSRPAAAPERLTSVQTEYLRAPMASRATISAKLASMPGAPRVSVRSGGFGSSTHAESSGMHGSTSRGGMSASHGVGTGG